MGHGDTTTNTTASSIKADAGERIAVYDDAEQARVAVKLLVNQGFTAEQLFVLCTDEKRSEGFRSRLMPAGAPQLNTAPSVVGGAGAALGAAVLGGAGLAAGPVVAAAGVAVGAVTGAGVGVLLGAGTYSDEETNELIERHQHELDAGKIVVVVRERNKDSAGSTDMEKAGKLLSIAEAA